MAVCVPCYKELECLADLATRLNALMERDINPVALEYSTVVTVCQQAQNALEPIEQAVIARNPMPE